jgi:hypothetical protein
MRRNGDRGLVGGDREILDRGYGFHRTGDRWLPDRWLGMPGSSVVVPPGGGDLVDGDPVSVWPDSSGTGHDATQSGSNRPIYKTNVINGKPVIRFASASSQFFNIPVISATGPWTSFAVVKVTSGNLTTIGTLGGSSTPSALIIDAAGNMSCGSKVDYGSFAAAASIAFHVFAVNFIPGSGYVFNVDGNALGPNVGAAPQNFDFNVIGRAGPYFSDGDIAEILFYNRSFYQIDPAGFANLQKYLGTKYGITVTGGTAVDPYTVQGLLAWYKADATVPAPKLNDGDVVTEWADSSGNGHYARGTGSILKKNVIGGQPVVRFSTAGSSKLDLATVVSGVGDTTIFVVMKPNSPTVQLWSIGGNSPDCTPYGPLSHTDGATYAISRATIVTAQGVADGAFHVVTSYMWNGAYTTTYKDGAEILLGASPFTSTGDYATIGYGKGPPPGYSDGDIAEIIVYQFALALRVKLSLLLATLLVTGQFPGTEEFERLIGHRDRIKRYLHRHNAHPTEEQLEDVVTPMAAGDRNGIEAYLGVKYGIPQSVAGNSPILPSNVPGMLGWWKADSL